MKKFWNKADEGNEILIYGDISSDKWFESDVTAKEFANDLKSFGGSDVTLRINSGGGDVFAAVAIANVIKNYSGKVHCSIDGLAASAATLITCACDTVTIANNALFMVHNPVTKLFGYFDETEISKVQNSLGKIKSSIVQTYIDKTGKTEEEISKLMTAETWYTAAEAKENKFVDKIDGEVETEFDDVKRILFVNSLRVDCRNFDAKKIKNKLEVKQMDDNSILAKIKNLLGGETKPATVEVKDSQEKNSVDVVAEARKQELTRMKNLNALRTGNKIVDAIINVGINDGATVEEVQKYVDAVKDFEETPKLDTDKTAQAILNIVKDNMNSGAEKVDGSTPATPSDDERTEKAKLIAKFANGLV